VPSKVGRLVGRRAVRIVCWRGPFRVTFWYRGPWRGISLPLVERFDLSGPIPVLLYSEVSSMPVKPGIAEGGNAPLKGASHGVWGKGMPTLSSWICDAVYTDGTPMGQVQVAVKRDGTVVRATLKVEDMGGVKCSAIGPDPASALAALELLLASPTAPWERDGYPLGSSARKKNK